MTILNTNLGLSQISPERMYQFDCVIFMINSFSFNSPSLAHLSVYSTYSYLSSIYFHLQNLYLLLFIFICFILLTYLCLYILYLFSLYNFFSFTLIYRIHFTLFYLLYLFHLFVNSIVNLLVATTKFTDFYQIIYCRYSNPEQIGR